jgi:hypothetical protein
LFSPVYGGANYSYHPDPHPFRAILRMFKIVYLHGWSVCKTMYGTLFVQTILSLCLFTPKLAVSFMLT